jgi:hypothetical protein
MHHDITGAAHTNTDLMVEHIKTKQWSPCTWVLKTATIGLLVIFSAAIMTFLPTP